MTLDTRHKQDTTQGTSKTLDTRHKTLDTRHKTFDTRHKTFDTRRKTLDTRCKKLDTRYRHTTHDIHCHALWCIRFCSSDALWCIRVYSSVAVSISLLQRLACSDAVSCVGVCAVGLLQCLVWRCVQQCPPIAQSRKILLCRTHSNEHCSRETFIRERPSFKRLAVSCSVSVTCCVMQCVSMLLCDAVRERVAVLCSV